jgi:hypothetical protein
MSDVMWKDPAFVSVVNEMCPGDLNVAKMLARVNRTKVPTVAAAAARKTTRKTKTATASARKTTSKTKTATASARKTG